MLRLTRRYRFSASHRLDTAALSAEENRKLYGKCNNPYGHGHDYALEISVEGPLNGDGQVVDRKALDELVQQQVLRLVDHKNLNLDVPEFGGAIPTTENLASFIQQRLSQGWSLTPRLTRIRIVETDRNSFELAVGEGEVGDESEVGE
jgi:6-pyruvoyltetrahydropterin/6-carboxytetrahydropterin synthase